MATGKPKAGTRSFDLREACLQAAREVISERGVEALSMRDVARRLGVSHQAPYRHFESRDHLLAEIMRRCFVDFAEALDRRHDAADPDAQLHAMGTAYLEYAARKPLEYRLMFGTAWPEPAQHPELVRHAVHAFDLLRHALRTRHGSGPGRAAAADLDALFIWSTLHGMASITQANVMPHLALPPGVVARFESALMDRIGAALAAAPPATAGSDEPGARRTTRAAGTPRAAAATRGAVRRPARR